MGGFRTPLLVGVAIGLVSIAAGAAALAAESSDGNGMSALAGVALMVVLAGVVGVVLGVFGRDHEWGLVAAIGIGAVATILVAVGIIVQWEGPSMLVALLVGPLLGAVAAAAGRVGWFAGNLACALTSRPTAGEIVEQPDLHASTAGLDDVARRHLPGEAIAGRAVGIEVGKLRYRRVAVVAGEHQLVVATLDGDDVVIRADRLASASIRSEAVDGTVRRPTNAYDDTITVVEPSGRSVTFVLPYEPPRIDVDTGVGGPGEIKAWIHRHADAYV